MLRIAGLTVQYPGRAEPAVDAVDLDVGPGETVAVLGPSGSGKSSLLRAVAGLVACGGRIEWNGNDLAGVAPHRRGFGLVFQEYALFPHRDVAGNVEFGLRMAGWPRPVRRERVAEVLELVGLAGFERRDPATLSGGEQQRVALARALAPRPRLLMLDEPLGALDQDLRRRLLRELRDILDATGVPALYVTHDHGEAFGIAHRVVVLRAGRAVQDATPVDLWSRPVDAWTAAFLGFGPAVEGSLLDGLRPAVTTPWGTLAATVAGGAPGAPRGSGGPGPAAVTVMLRPGAVTPSRDEAGELTGRVLRCDFAGEHWRTEVAVGDGPPIVVSAPRPIPPGASLTLAVDPAGVLCYPRA